jgi:hypothetical protein
MGSSKYLDSVLKVMPAIQARQIADLLNKLKVAGEIRSADEYASKLKELSVLINDTVPIPSFKIIPSIPWVLCSSAAHNAMMDAIKNDLEALYLQVNEIGNKLNDYHFLMMENLITDLEKGIQDQENTIKRLEWLASEDNEFSYALINSFESASSLRVIRSDLAAKGLFFDNRTLINKTEKELPSAVIDEYGKKLIISSQNNPLIRPISVTKQSDEYSYGTEEQVDFDNNINNLIDGKKNTYWTRTVYLFSPVEKVTTLLNFDLGIGKDINYIVIEGATIDPFFIESIKGIYTDGSTVDLISDEVEVNGKIRIDFNRVFVKAFQITFAVYSYIKAEYFVPYNSEVNELIIDSNKYSILNNELNSIEKTTAIKSLIADTLNTKSISTALNIVTEKKRKQINAFSYCLSLDNVWAGYSLYSDIGIFVSKPLTADNFGIIGVEGIENIKENTVKDSIEYEIIKRDRYPYFKENIFPIPKIGQTSIDSERLILIKKEDSSDIEDVGSLRFCPNVLETDKVKVYENGKELILGDANGFQYAVKINPSTSRFDWKSTWDDSYDFSNYTLSPQKMWIKIMRPNVNSIYTVEYTIRTSDSQPNDNTVWLDTEKTIYLSDKGRVIFRRDDLDKIITSDIYLQITLRKNTSISSISPELLEYGILGTTYVR